MKNTRKFYRGIEITRPRIEWLSQMVADYNKRRYYSSFYGYNDPDAWDNNNDFFHKSISFNELAYGVIYSVEIFAQPSIEAIKYLPEFMEELRRVEG